MQNRINGYQEADLWTAKTFIYFPSSSIPSLCMCYNYNKGPIFSCFQSLYAPELWKGDARDKRMAVRRQLLWDNLTLLQ